MFFDDAFASSHEWLHPTVQHTAAAMWDHFGVSMADGRPHELRSIKSKSEIAPPGSSLPALGNSLSLDYPGRRSVAPSKLLRYLDEGHSLIDDTADAKPVAQKRLHKWVSCVAWPAQMDALLRAALQTFYEESQIFNWPLGSARSLSVASRRSLHDLVTALQSMHGHALMPTQAPMGLFVPLYFLYSDAAKDAAGPWHAFRGLGLFFFRAGTTDIFARKGRWTHHEERYLEIDTLEMGAGNTGLRSLIETLKREGFPFRDNSVDTQTWSLDVSQIFDNSSIGTYVSNTGKASGATRQASRARTELLTGHGIRAHSEHSVRETALSGMADSLSKGDTDSFERVASQLFGPEATITYLPDLETGDPLRDLTQELRLAIQSEKRRKKRRLPGAGGAQPTMVAHRSGEIPAPPETPSRVPLSHWPRPGDMVAFPVQTLRSLGVATEHYRKRLSAGQQRPSETQRMHTLPFIVGSEWIFPDTPKLSHANNRIAASSPEVLAHPDVVLCAPAHTTPPSADLAKSWIEQEQQKLHAERVAYDQRCDWFDSLGPLSPDRITHRWPEVESWMDAYLAEILRCERNSRARFDYNNIPGGRLGIRIPPDDIHPEFRGLFFEIQGRQGPVVARRWIDPQSNTELRLDRIWEYVCDTLDSEQPFPDLHIAFELCFRGLSNRSDCRPCGITLAPNYKKLWQHPWLQTAQRKLRAKQTQFSPPRVSPPSRWLSRIPGAMAVANMATDQLDATGEVKPRLTLDHGFGGREGQLPPGEQDPSINGNTPQDDLSRFPAIKYLKMDEYAKACAILLEAGEPMSQSAEDCEAYYEQLPREWREAHYQLLCLESAGVREDPRLEFGVAAECHTSNRISFLFTWIRQRETQFQQRRAEARSDSTLTPVAP
jgi:hypothetical protein